MKNINGDNKYKGFTLVELVIVIVIVGILSIVGQVVYRNYTKQAVISEGRALMGAILTSQKAYYVENRKFYKSTLETDTTYTSMDEVLGVDASGNKYFSVFNPSAKSNEDLATFVALAPMPSRARYDGKSILRMEFNVSSGYILVNDKKFEQIS